MEERGVARGQGRWSGALAGLLWLAGFGQIAWGNLAVTRAVESTHDDWELRLTVQLLLRLHWVLWAAIAVVGMATLAVGWPVVRPRLHRVVAWIVIGVVVMIAAGAFFLGSRALVSAAWIEDHYLRYHAPGAPGH